MYFIQFKKAFACSNHNVHKYPTDFDYIRTISWIKWDDTKLPYVIHTFYSIGYIDGLVQDCSNSSVLAMELLHSHAKPSTYPSKSRQYLLSWRRVW